MTINIDQNDYIFGDTAGVRIVALPQNQMAFPEDEGITISPGFYTQVAIAAVYVILQLYIVIFYGLLVLWELRVLNTERSCETVLL